MELIRGIHNIKPKHRGCVATIGNYDGLHRGHQRIIQQVKSIALEQQLPATMILFEPQPMEFFKGDAACARLMRLREKLTVLRDTGIDRVLCIHFTQQFATISAQDFVKEVLVDKLGVHTLVVGDDFRFGHRRQGDYNLLQSLSDSYGFALQQRHTVSLAEERISSSRVRQALQRGDLQQAEQLLGRQFSLSGRVAHGAKKGRTIGFPTANIYLHRQVTPIRGVYVVEVQGIDGQVLSGVANVGNRPTVDGSRTLLEVHLFDFNQEIYGHQVTVTFLQKLRDEKKFDSFDLLCEQIQRDAQAAKDFFKGEINE